MKFELPKINLAAFAAAVGVSSAAGFQVGYFREIGLQFISMASFADALLVAAAIVPSVGFLLIQSVENIDIVGKLLSIRWAKIAFVAVVVFACLGYAIGGPTAAWKAIASTATITFLFWLVVQMATSTHVIIQAIEDESGIVHWTHYNGVLVGAFVASMLVGGWEFGTSKNCGIEREKGRLVENAEYLRSVSDGHLFRLEGRTHFISKSEVKEFWCGIRAPAKPQPSIPKFAPTLPPEYAPRS